MTWYQASNYTQTDLPDNTVAHSVRKFWSLIWCRAPITVAQEAATAPAATVDHITESFEAYLER
eukprot:3218655-Ditylum_brightwellii.AAC.1